MPAFGIVVNPQAGGNRRVADRAQRLARLIGDDGVVREADRVEQLVEVAREFRERGVEILGLCGGDGSFFRALSAVAGVYGRDPLPVLLPLRAGTMNTVARGVGAPRGRPEEVLQRLRAQRQRAEGLPTAARQLLCVNGRFLGFMAGAGAIVGFLQAYYAGRVKGPIGAALLVGKLAMSALNGGRLVRRVFDWVDADVRCDGERVRFERFSIIYASTIKDIGLGFRPTYRANDALGCFHVLAGPLAAMETVRCLWKIHRGLPTRSPQLDDRVGRRVTVEFREPKPYMIDGDVMDRVSGFTIEAGPVLQVVTETVAR